jgi:hypothetical protein
MKLAGRIPVEPLDDERLTNIERRVVAGAVDAAGRRPALRPSRPQIRRVLAIGAIACAGVAGWVLRGEPDRDPAIAEPAAIALHTDRERSRLELGDATIESDPATVFAVTRPGGGVLVTMTRGKVELEVGKRGARPPLIVRAGDTDVVVVGTHFTVDYGDGRGDVDVRVREGVVRVVHRQRETRVAAGQGWRTPTGLIASAEDSAAPRSDAPRHPGAGPDGSAGDGRDGAVPDVPGAGEAAPAQPTPRPRPSRPVRDDRRRPPHAGSSDPSVDLKTAIRAQHVEPALDLGDLDAARAIEAYSSIAAHRSGAEASQAFYSIAVVDHLRLGRNSDALHWLDAYVRRFPGGKEYRAALWLRVRVLCLARIDDRCRAAAYRYLHEASDGPAARIAERLTQTP